MRVREGPHKDAADRAGREAFALGKGEVAKANTDARHQRDRSDEDEGPAGEAKQANRDTFTANPATRRRKIKTGERDEHEDQTA